MNTRCFKVIFSRRLGALVVVALELGCATAVQAQAQPQPQPAPNALPAGGVVSSGSASISTQGNVQGAAMTIQQSSARSSINWNSFNVGSAATVTIVQPGKDAVLLNRVVGPDASRIQGRISANGQVMLINPNGIVFGPGSTVNAAGFIASTMGLSDDSFLSGNYQFNRSSTAGVLNQGSISAEAGGYVALLGATVSNEGRINAPAGSVVLAGAQSVQTTGPEGFKVPVGSSGRVRLNLTPADVNVAISNSATGVIQAEGGQVLLQASALNDAMHNANANANANANTSAAQSSITQSGRIDTRSAQTTAQATDQTGAQANAQSSGTTLLAQGGSIRVDGSILADQGGSIIIGRDTETGALAARTDVSGAVLHTPGGFVETSGDWLKTDGIAVQAADWLLDPSNITIAAANSNIQGDPNFVPTSGAATSTIDVATIASALNAGTSVTINTTNSGTAGTADGTITVASAISKTAGTEATLTLNANNGIAVNAAIGASGAGTGKLNVNMTAAGVAANSANSFGIDMRSTIDANGGTVNLSGTSNRAGTNGITFNNGSGVLAGTYTITGTANATTGSGNGVQMVGGATTTFSSTTGASVMRGSTASSAGKGVFISGASTVTNISTGSGSATLENAAASAGGVRVGFGGGATVNTSGNVTLGSQNNNTSDLIAQGTFNATSGSLNFKGQSATFAGVIFQDGGGVAARVTGTNGAVINVDGISTAAGNYGVDLSGPLTGGIFSTSGAGNSINITGTGSNIGVSTRQPSASLTANNGGSINITGTSTGSNVGVEVNGTLSAAAGSINITSDTVSITSTANISTGASGGTVTIANKTAGTAINLGGADVTTGATKTLGLTDAELDRITTANLLIGATGATASGTTTVSANLTPALAKNLSVRSGADIVLAASTSISTLSGGNLTLNADADGNNSGAVFFNGSSGVNSNGGNINIGGGTAGDASGYAVGNSTYIDGIFMESGSVVNAAGGSITMLGKSAALTTGTPGTIIQNGIRGRSNTITTTGAGNISLTGQGQGGGSLSQSMGLRFQTATIFGGSTGSVALTGSGSVSDTRGLNYGVYLVGGTVSSTGGNVSVTGTGGGANTTIIGGNYGIELGGSQTVSAGGTGTVTVSATGGSATATNNYGLHLSGTNAKIASTGGAINVTAAGGGNGTSYGVYMENAGAIASGGNAAVTITTDSLRLGATESISAGTGTLTVQNKTAGTLVDLGGTDVLSTGSKTLALSDAEIARMTAGTLVVGRSDASAAGIVSVSSAITTGTSGNLTVKTGNSININAALNVGSGSKNLTLQAANSVTQSAALTAAGLDLQGAASYALGNTANSVATLATAAGVGAVNYANNGALTIGTVGTDSGISSTGPVSVATQTGALTVASSISTTDASAAAVVLNAGKSLSANTATAGSDVLISGSPTITTGAGGRATLYTGTVAGSTGVTTLVGSGSGRFRYKSDEVASNFSTALGSGLYAVYRESPLLNIAVQNISRGYDTTSFSGGTAVASGNVNGDTANQIGSNLTWGGNAQGAVNAGSYSILANGSNALGYTESFSNNPATLTISQATLQVIANNDARFVTLADTAGYNGVSYVGFQGAETSAVLGGTAVVTRPNSANDVSANTYTGALVPSGVTSGNYQILFVNGTYDIVAAKGMIIRTANSAQTYGTAATFADPVVQYLDGNGSSISNLTKTAQSGNTYTYNDGAGGAITFTLAPAGAAVSSSNNTVVGSYLLKDTAPLVTGNNFNAPPVFVGQLSINTKGVNATASGVTKGYDGTTTMPNLVLGAQGKVGIDFLDVSGTGSFTSKNAGSNLAYSVTNLALSGADAGNYFLNGGSSLSGTDGAISAAPLQLTTSSVTKMYDGGTSATGNLQAVGGTQIFAGDSVSGGTFSFDSKTVGSGNKTVSTSGATVNDGNGGGNYIVTYVDNTTSSISPKAITVSGISAANKTYDGTTSATTSTAGAVLTGLVGGDTVTVSASGAFADKDAGVSKPVAVTSTYGGADLANYTITEQTSALADIAPKVLAVALQGTVAKVYDGTTAATLSDANLQISGFVSGDGGTVSQTTGAYASKNVNANNGTGLVTATLGASDFTADANTNFNNYALPANASGQVGTITPKPISSSYTAANKAYDGTTTASVSGVASGVVAGDVVQLSNSAANFDTAAVGKSKTVTVSGIAAGGPDGSNYTLSSTIETTLADITPAVVPNAAPSLPVPVVNPIVFANAAPPAIRMAGAVQTKEALDETRKGLRCRPVSGVANYTVCEPQAAINETARP